MASLPMESHAGIKHKIAEGLTTMATLSIERDYTEARRTPGPLPLLLGGDSGEDRSTWKCALGTDVIKGPLRPAPDCRLTRLFPINPLPPFAALNGELEGVGACVGSWVRVSKRVSDWKRKEAFYGEKRTEHRRGSHRGRTHSYNTVAVAAKADCSECRKLQGERQGFLASVPRRRETRTGTDLTWAKSGNRSCEWWQKRLLMSTEVRCKGGQPAIEQAPWRGILEHGHSN